MDRFIEIHVTTGSIDEARTICRTLVKDKLVACAQIIPWVESCYLWNGQLETVQESKIFLKTTEDQYDAVEAKIIEISSYDIPEITCTVIEKGSDEYLAWIKESRANSINS